MERAIAILIIAAVLIFVLRAVVRRQQAERAENFQEAVGTPISSSNAAVTRGLSQFMLWRRANSIALSATDETQSGLHLHTIDYRHGTSTSDNRTFSYILIWIDRPTITTPNFVAERRDNLPNFLQNVENRLNNKKPIALPNYPAVEERFMISSAQADETTLQALFDGQLGRQFTLWAQDSSIEFIEVRHGELVFVRDKPSAGEVSAEFIAQTKAEAIKLWQILSQTR